MEATTLRDRRGLRGRLSCSTDLLKWLGLLCMCMGSVSVAVLQRSVLHLDTSAPQALHEALKPGGKLVGMASLAMSCDLASYIAIPVYAKLTCEGWLHTNNQRQYLFRLIAAALISEIPYDLVFNGTVWDLSSQNPIWSLAVAVLMLAMLSQFHRPGFGGVVMDLMAVAGACLWTMLLHSSQGLLLVVLVAVFYLLRERKSWALGVGAAVSLVQFPAPLGILLVYWYNGNRGKAPRWLFYALYPVQLMLFWLLAEYLG